MLPEGRKLTRKKTPPKSATVSVSHVPSMEVPTLNRTVSMPGNNDQRNPHGQGREKKVGKRLSKRKNGI